MSNFINDNEKKDYQKLLKNFVAKRYGREELKKPWQKDGAIIATNSYILAKIEEPEAMKNTPGEYPNINSIITINDKREIIFDVEYLYNIAKLYKDLNTKNKHLKQVRMYIDKDDFTPVIFYQDQFKATAAIMPARE